MRDYHRQRRDQQVSEGAANERESTTLQDVSIAWVREIQHRGIVPFTALELFTLFSLPGQAPTENKASIYLPLKPWQTRLLIIEPGLSSEAVHCRLIPVDIIDGSGLGIADTVDTTTYDALSYAWGDPAPASLAFVNGQVFSIATELANAFLYLRKAPGEGEKVLWCDAGCINQENLEEKSRQTKSMLRIFEKAETVIAWIGRPCSSTGRFFRALSILGDTDGTYDPFRPATKWSDCDIEAMTR